MNDHETQTKPLIGQSNSNAGLYTKEIEAIKLGVVLGIWLYLINVIIRWVELI